MSSNIKLLRELRGISQQKLAEELSTTQQNIFKYEKGLTSPPPEMLKSLADYFEVSTDFILCYSEYPHKVTDPEFSSEEVALIEKYRKLSDIQKGAIDTIVNSYLV